MLLSYARQTLKKPQNSLASTKGTKRKFQKKTLVNSEFTRVKCGRWDLNPHGIAATRSLVLLVCQFRHFRICYQFPDDLYIISFKQAYVNKKFKLS